MGEIRPRLRPKEQWDRLAAEDRLSEILEEMRQSGPDRPSDQDSANLARAIQASVLQA